MKIINNHSDDRQKSQGNLTPYLSHNQRSQIIIAVAKDDNLTSILGQKYIVENVTQTMEVLSAINHHPPDLLIIDKVELLQKLQNQPNTRKIQILILSEQSSCIEALEAGADDYLVKPFSPVELLTRVQLNLKIAQREHTFCQTESRLQLAKQVAKPETWDWDLLTNINYITERLRIEKALLQSEQRFRQMAETIEDVFWIADLAQKRMIYLSPGYEKIWGQKRNSSEKLFVNWMKTVYPEDREKVKNSTNLCLEQGSFDIEYRIIRPNGSIRWIRDRGFMVEETPEQSAYTVGIAQDITDRKQDQLSLQERAQELTKLNEALSEAMSKLEKRNQELDQFGYIVSHDLKAPFRAISNLSEWIEEDLNGQLPPENQKQMQLLRQRVQRMEKLIDAMLEYSRVGRKNTSLEQVSVAELLKEIIDSLSASSTFTIEIGPCMPTFTTYRLLLAQVFTNLISNGIKHHPRPDGYISITAQSKGNFYEFSVFDDGKGIASEHHDRIFAIFHTLEPSETKENTGIGLAIVKKLIDSQGGTIEVESQVGQGTTFRFTWPKSVQNTT